MTSSKEFNSRVELLKRRGYTEDMSSRIAVALGDNVELDELGRWVAREGETVIAVIQPLRDEQ